MRNHLVDHVHWPDRGDKQRRDVLAALDPRQTRLTSEVLDYDGWRDDEHVTIGHFTARLRCAIYDRGDGLSVMAIVDVEGSECRASSEQIETRYRLLGLRFSRHDDGRPALYVPDIRNALTDAIEEAIIDWLEETVDGQRLMDIARSDIPAYDEPELWT